MSSRTYCWILYPNEKLRIQSCNYGKSSSSKRGSLSFAEKLWHHIVRIQNFDMSRRVDSILQSGLFINYICENFRELKIKALI